MVIIIILGFMLFIYFFLAFGRRVEGWKGWVWIEYGDEFGVMRLIFSIFLWFEDCIIIS